MFLRMFGSLFVYVLDWIKVGRGGVWWNDLFFVVVSNFKYIYKFMVVLVFDVGYIYKFNCCIFDLVIFIRKLFFICCDV